MPIQLDGRSSAQGATHRTLAERAFNELRNQILAGDLMSGERLRIRELAASLGMSVMPIREALRQLESVGLVEHRPHYGATVTEVSAAELTDLLRARLALEPYAAQLAAERFTAVAAAGAEEALRDYALAADASDLTRVRSADHAFHASVYEASGSPWLRRLIRPVWESAERYRRITAPTRAELSLRQSEHQAVLEACVQGSGCAAAHAMEQHLKQSANAVARMVDMELPFPQLG